MLDPFAHAERVTGCEQSAVVDAWTGSGIAVAVSEVTGPRIYRYGSLPVTTLAVTLYKVRRHVLTVDGRVRRDGCVWPGRFRIGQPSRDVVVDAHPNDRSGKLVLMYLGPNLLSQAGENDDEPVELAARAWDQEDPFIHALAIRMVETSRTNDARERLLADQVAVTLASHLVSRYGVDASPKHVRPGGKLTRASRDQVIDYMHASSFRCTLAELATVSGFGSSQFLRLFQNTTGTTPHRYLIGLRLARAETLLATSQMPIAEIALACGFSSQSHLGASFLAARGVSPAHFRRSRRGRS